MKYLFLVQGEGRGHITQAIALHDMLRENGHEVAGVLLGTSLHRPPPKFFLDKFSAEISFYESPNFLYEKDKKGIHLFFSILYNLARVPKFVKSIRFIHSIVAEKKPDVIVNFYDMIGGLYNLFYKGTKTVCIGHHFLLGHTDFQTPKGRKIEKWLMRMLNSIVAINAEKKLAISFRPMEEKSLGKIKIMPPLLRKSILTTAIKDLKHGNFILGYLLNQGFSEEILTWHEGNKALPAHFFWDKNDAPSTLAVNENLSFHQIDGSLFLEYFKNCRMFAGTAGFESLCEAMYLGKPFLCVPSVNHFEQACNALDATRDGAGIWHDKFDLDKLIEFMKNYNFDVTSFRKWVDRAPEMYIKQLT
jgi:uncharacterized protein (TIGR00661 family)